ncbi:MAG: hypothetical protein HYV13_00080 [Candidatus Doudnabacteria bacterium]|nr:hypothetical protein [Candidatus Doudnabacteria bacterium]
MSEGETIYSEPIEKAEGLIEQGNNLQQIVENLSKDKARAQELLNTQLTKAQKSRLAQLIEKCDQSITEIKTKQTQLSQDIQNLLAEHLVYKDILDNFEPDTYH